MRTRKKVAAAAVTLAIAAGVAAGCGGSGANLDTCREATAMLLVDHGWADNPAPIATHIAQACPDGDTLIQAQLENGAYPAFVLGADTWCGWAPGVPPLCRGQQ